MFTGMDHSPKKSKLTKMNKSYDLYVISKVVLNKGLVSNNNRNFDSFLVYFEFNVVVMAV